MLPLGELRGFARAAAAEISRYPEFAEFEVYCASSLSRIARLSYTSDIACRGVEEIKSLGADGFQVRVVMRANRHEVGTASEAGDLSRDALRRAVDRARRAAIVDPHFPGLARDKRKMPRQSAKPGDLARAGDAVLASCAWRVVDGALGAFTRGYKAATSSPGLIIGGDVTIVHDRIAIVNSNLPEIRTDESAHFVSSVTALVESIDAKGTDSAVGGSSAAMRTAAGVLGRNAVLRALRLGAETRPPSGRYRVVLGPQPIAEILNYMVMGSLTTGSFFAASSAYQGRFGDRVMDERLSLSDDPVLRAGPVHRRITCEGLPARKTDLIKSGRLIGLLSSVYDSHRLETDEERAEKLGPLAAEAKFAPSAGYRLGEGGGRRFDADVGAAGTNIVLRARGGVSDRAMLEAVGDGLYIGRVWYTYPINGQRAGDFTCTVSGDSYLIRGGKIAEPLAPNCLRINANISEVFTNPIAITAKVAPTIVWGSSETYFVPAIAVEGLTVSEIGANMQ